MSGQDFLARFDAANRNLQFLPLLTEDQIRKFWVEYGTENIEDLEQWLENCTSNDNKLVFTGHTGCGKSTLLAEFCRHRQVADRYFVVFFSITGVSEMSDVNHVNILFSIAVHLMETAEKDKVRIPSETKKVLYRWFGEQTQTETSAVEKELEESTGGGVGINLASIVKFLADIKTKLKTNEVIRQDITTKFARRISELVDRIDEIAALVEGITRKPILIIIDDLDKLDSEQTNRIYGNNIQLLFQPQFRIIYTISITVIRDIPLRTIIHSRTDKIRVMRITKFFSKRTAHQPEPQPEEKPIQLFEEILYKRMPRDLIEPKIARAMILKSGGVLREFIRLASLCCQECSKQIRGALRRSDSLAGLPQRIDEAILQKVLIDLQIERAEPL